MYQTKKCFKVLADQSREKKIKACWQHRTSRKLKLTYALRQLVKFLIVSWPKYCKSRPLKFNLSRMKKLVPDWLHDMMSFVSGSSTILYIFLKKGLSISLNPLSCISLGLRKGNIVELDQLILPLERTTSSSSKSCSINLGIKLGSADDLARKISIFCCLSWVACRLFLRKAKAFRMLSSCCFIIQISVSQEQKLVFNISTSVSIGSWFAEEAPRTLLFQECYYFFHNIWKCMCKWHANTWPTLKVTDCMHDLCCGLPKVHV